MIKMSKKELSKEEFLKKHPPITDEEVKKKLAEASQRKAEYTKNIEELEKNILGLQEIIEPLIDPNTDKILAWMRLPTNEELEEYYFTYKDADLAKLSGKDRIKQVNRQYELMADVIEKPKKKWDWWKKNTTPHFTRLFAIKLTSMFETLGVAMENF